MFIVILVPKGDNTNDNDTPWPYANLMLRFHNRQIKLLMNF